MKRKRLLKIGALLLIFFLLPLLSIKDNGTTVQAAISKTYLGRFYLLEPFAKFVVPYGTTNYEVTLVYRGSMGNYLLIFVLSSPENPIIPGGYAYIPKNNSGSYYTFTVPVGADNAITFEILRLASTAIDVWKYE